MNSSLGWIAFGVGIAGTVLGSLAGRQAEAERLAGTCKAALIALLGTIVLFLCTLPSGSPFSPGLGLGSGILVGGLLGVVAGLISARAEGGTRWTSTLSAAGMSAAALVGVSLILLLFASYPQPALGGFLIGALASGIVFRFVMPAGGAMDVWIISSIALGAGSLLATFRFTTPDVRFWWTAPALLASAAIVATVAGAGLSRAGERRTTAVLVSALITLILALLFAWKVFPQWPLLWCAIAGVASFALIAWLTDARPVSTGAAAVSAVLVVAFSALAFKFLAGFGMSLGLLAAASVLLSSSGETDRPTRPLVYAFYIGAGMLLLRLFLETYSSETSLPDLTTHYSFVAVCLGIVLPFLFASAMPEFAKRASALCAANAVILGILAAAAPLVIVVAWGFKAEFGFLIGLLASQIVILMLAADPSGESRAGFLSTAALATAAQVSAVQLSGLVAGLNDGPRVTRLTVLAVFAAVVLIWALVSSLCARREEEA